MEFITKQKAQKLNKLVDSLAEILKESGQRDIAVGFTNERLYEKGEFVFMSIFLYRHTVWCKYTKTQIQYVLAQLYKRHNIELNISFYTIGVIGHGENGDIDMSDKMTMIKPMEYLVLDGMKYADEE